MIAWLVTELSLLPKNRSECFWTAHTCTAFLLNIKDKLEIGVVKNTLAYENWDLNNKPSNHISSKAFDISKNVFLTLTGGLQSNDSCISKNFNGENEKNWKKKKKKKILRIKKSSSQMGS